MKKKLVWKFNIVDLVVIAVIVVLAVFFASKFLKSSRAAANVQQGTITYEVAVTGMTREMYDEVSSFVPCQMAASGEWVNGQIQSVRAEPCEVTYLEISSPVNSNEKQYVAADPDTEYVTAIFTCEAKVNLNDMFNMVGTQEIRVGRSHYIKGVDIELIGTILNLHKAAG